MAKKAVVILLLGISMILSGGQEKDPDPSKKIKIKKSPKRVYESYYVYQFRSKKWKKRYSNKLFKVYNRKGQVAEMVYLFKGYPGTGKKMSYRKYFYNHRGKMTKMQVFSKGRMRVYYIFNYNRKGKLIKQKSYRNGRLTGILTVRYKTGFNGKIYESRTYRGRRLVARKSYHYSPKGYLVKRYSYDSRNRLKAVIQYDINGKKIVEKLYFYYFKPPSMNKIVYTYDRFGNCTEKLTYNSYGRVSTKEVYTIIY